MVTHLRDGTMGKHGTGVIGIGYRAAAVRQVRAASPFRAKAGALVRYDICRDSAAFIHAKDCADAAQFAKKLFAPMPFYG